MYKNYGSLCIHIELFHESEKLKATCTCDICGVDYYSTTRLDSHMKSEHTGSYKCFYQSCPSRFENVGAIRRHFLGHHKQSVEVRLTKNLKNLHR